MEPELPEDERDVVSELQERAERSSYTDSWQIKSGPAGAWPMDRRWGRYSTLTVLGAASLIIGAAVGLVWFSIWLLHFMTS